MCIFYFCGIDLGFLITSLYVCNAYNYISLSSMYCSLKQLIIFVALKVMAILANEMLT